MKKLAMKLNYDNCNHLYRWLWCRWLFCIGLIVCSWSVAYAYARGRILVQHDIATDSYGTYQSDYPQNGVPDLIELGGDDGADDN